MTKYILFAALFMLTACTPPQQPLAQCPPLRIDVAHPDFYQKHTYREVEEFYSCMEGNAQANAANANIFQKMAWRINHNDSTPSLHAALEYQRNLWREVLNREKKPGAAYEAWTAWVQNERSINAANASAAAEESAAQAERHSTNTTCMANGPFLNCNSY